MYCERGVRSLLAPPRFDPSSDGFDRGDCDVATFDTVIIGFWDSSIDVHLPLWLPSRFESVWATWATGIPHEEVGRLGGLDGFVGAVLAEVESASEPA